MGYCIFYLAGLRFLGFNRGTPLVFVGGGVEGPGVYNFFSFSKKLVLILRCVVEIEPLVLMH